MRRPWDAADGGGPEPGAGGGKPGTNDGTEREAKGGAAPSTGPATIRPSLWAGLDIVVKAVAGLAFLLVPAAIGVLLHGGRLELLAVLAALSFVEGIDLLYALVAAAFPLAQLAFTRYVIDDEGIRVATQLFTRSEKSVRWDKVTLLRQRRTLVDRLFGIERLDVVAYGERGATFHLVGLRDAASLRRLVALRMREHASVGGVLGED